MCSLPIHLRRRVRGVEGREEVGPVEGFGARAAGVDRTLEALALAVRVVRVGLGLPGVQREAPRRCFSTIRCYLKREGNREN